jgi:hypothetical protein
MGPVETESRDRFLICRGDTLSTASITDRSASQFRDADMIAYGPPTLEKANATQE